MKHMCACTWEYDCAWCEAEIDRVEEYRNSTEKGHPYDVW